MTVDVDNAPSGIANMSSAVVSEADPVLPLPPVLQDFIDETLLLDTADDEQAPLLRKQREKFQPWYRRAAPKLLVPFALASALCRGMTLAPRVEVFTRIACDELRIEPDVLRNYSSANLGLSIDLDQSLALVFVAPQPRLPGRAHLATVAHFGNDNNLHAIPDSTPISSDMCRADPAVQQGAAKLQTFVLVLAGTLSSLTAGFWGQFGDKHGRKVVISLGIFGMLASDCVFLLAASQSTNPTYSFLTASRILVISPIVEGLLGGFPTLQAGLNAYISDSTHAGTSRAKIFARFFGFLFAGVAAGPTISNLLPLNPFYSSIALGTANLVLVLLLLPESLTQEKRMTLAASRVLVEAEAPRPENQIWVKRMSSYVTGTLRGTFEPMAILLPRKWDSQGEGISGYNWNLTYLAISLSLYLLTISIYSVKFLYAEHAFGWGGKQLSYYISFMGCIRALNLIVILPYLIKVYKPKLSEHPDSPSADHAFTSPAVSPHGSTTVLNTPATPSQTRSIPTSSPSPPLTHGQTLLPGEPSPASTQSIRRSILHLREQQFDLLVARLSIAMDFLSYFLLCSATSATGFVLTTSLSALGGGTSPALQSLALGTLGGEEKDVGKLFGALSMLSSISSTILSPLVFGSLYSLTVVVFPKAIFIVATAVLTVALVFLALVQLSRPLGRPDVEVFPPRDRSERAKDLRRTHSG
ncbi:unnamed protein product [Rhizoctonia solani]|uniref:Uncharacterized protein n=1 Tax=Rhizoctonia solani TaxID=456999 RepID=A0A8H3D8J2_9AGAM|nr:unnamed protein product [Rhizoctonia solani]